MHIPCYEDTMESSKTDLGDGGYACQRRDLPPTATQPSVGSGKEIPEVGG